MSKQQWQSCYYLVALFACGAIAVNLLNNTTDVEKPEPIGKPTFIEIRPTPAVIPQPAPEVKPAPVKPRDITTEPTAKLLAEWDQWRRGPAPRTQEIQIIYETLLSRGVIRRDGEPVSEGYGGRRKIGRRR